MRHRGPLSSSSSSSSITSSSLETASGRSTAAKTPETPDHFSPSTSRGISSPARPQNSGAFVSAGRGWYAPFSSTFAPPPPPPPLPPLHQIPTHPPSPATPLSPCANPYNGERGRRNVAFYNPFRFGRRQHQNQHLHLPQNHKQEQAHSPRASSRHLTSPGGTEIRLQQLPFIATMMESSPNDSKGGSNSTGDSSANIVESLQIPKFAYSELTLGRILGQGGFSTVNEIKSIDLDDIYDTSEHETAIRKELASMANRRGLNESDGGSNKFVMKTLRNDLPEEEHTKGVVDLAIEADFLSVLQHPNIIAMRGMANSDPHSVHFFVILDRLTRTLDRRFNYWRTVVGENSGYWVPCFGYCCSNAPALHSMWKDRLHVALDIARAMQHLHKQHIVYRDLKPDNIGFDHSDQLKIFDFGLAKRLDDGTVERVASTGLYRLTGNTGSLRYMAPEVAKDQPYDQSVDLYSFGIIFWQICSLQTPYAGFSQKMHADKVLKQGHRPTPDPSWPMAWTDLMTTCWSSNREARPSFDHVVAVLSEQIDDLNHDEGVVPSRASEIRAKQRRKKVTPDNQRLDVDTRLSTGADSYVKRFETDIV